MNYEYGHLPEHNIQEVFSANTALFSNDTEITIPTGELVIVDKKIFDKITELNQRIDEIVKQIEVLEER